MRSRLFLFFAVSWLAAFFDVSARADVLTWHNDLFRTGQNTNETILTPANVNANSFGLLFSYPVDGKVFGQPLIVNGLAIPGLGTRNVLFVTTQHNGVYAFDADSNTGTNGGLIWSVNFGPSATTPNNDFGNRYGPYHDIDPEVGITSTPVIDRAAGVIYVEAFTHEGSAYFHRLYALDITTGAEMPNSPTTVAASFPGIGVGSTNGIITFNAMQQIQRSALTLAGGKIYASYAGYADTDPYHGWILGFNASNLQLATNYVFNDSPNSTIASYGANAGEGGIWMSGAGLAVDSSNNLFLLLGNGSYNANTPGGTEYGDSVIRVSTTNGLSVTDYFTPYDQANLAIYDTDLGSGGPMLLPDAVGSASHPHLMLGCGKEGWIYLLDRDNLGKFNAVVGASNDPQIVQELSGAVGGTWSSPAYFNHRIFYQGSGDVMKSYLLASGNLVASPVTQSTTGFGFPGATPSISASNTVNAIAWVIQSDGAESGGQALLHAYDAYNLSTELYNSGQSGNRDLPGVAVKFTVPTVANGKVYVGATKNVGVYGNGSFISVPVISPAGGLFTNSVQATLSDATPGATIYYTLDGSTPGTNSPVYTSPITISHTALLNVRAILAGKVPSPIVSAEFVNSAETNFSTGFLFQQFYSGAMRANLENPAFTTPPNSTEYINSFEAPTGLGNNYAERVSGYFIPPVTTNYVFFVCSDDDSDLFLSTDASPTNKHRIAQETAWSNSRQWTSSAGGSTLSYKRSDQYSATTWPGGNTIHLLAGVKYYIEGDQHQGVGGDNFEATYKFSGAADPADGTAPALTGSVIGTTTYSNTSLTINPQPRNTAVIQGTAATLVVSGLSAYLGDNSSDGPPVNCQWQSAPAGSGTFTNLPGATAFVYVSPSLGLGQSGVQFRAILSTVGSSATSAVAKVVVVPDTRPPLPVKISSVSANGLSVVVAFSKPLDPVTAARNTNYLFGPGLFTPTIASLDATGTNVMLTLGSALAQNITNTLAIANVKDAQGKTVQPGTAITFTYSYNPSLTLNSLSILPASLQFTSINAALNQVVLQWMGNATLQESSLVTGPWTNSANQSNPQVVPMTTARFYRLKQ